VEQHGGSNGDRGNRQGEPQHRQGWTIGAQRRAASARWNGRRGSPPIVQGGGRRCTVRSGSPAGPRSASSPNEARGEAQAQLSGDLKLARPTIFHAKPILSCFRPTQPGWPGIIEAHLCTKTNAYIRHCCH
jgi:hypothetical protein